MILYVTKLFCHSYNVIASVFAGRIQSLVHLLHSISLSYTDKTIVSLWLVAGITALPYAFYTRTYHHVMDPDTGLALPDSLICSVPADWLDDVRVIIQFSTFSLFALPMTIITVLYVFIGLTVRRSITSTTSTAAYSPATTTTGETRRTSATSIINGPATSRRTQTSTRRSSPAILNSAVVTTGRGSTLLPRTVTGTILSLRRSTAQKKTVVKMLGR